MVILLWPVLFAFSSSRSSYLLDEAQEALHPLPQQHQPAAPLALCFTKSCPSTNQPPAPEQSCSLQPAALVPLKNPSLLSAVTRKHTVFSLKKKKTTQGVRGWTLSNLLTGIFQHKNRQRRKIMRRKEKVRISRGYQTAEDKVEETCLPARGSPALRAPCPVSPSFEEGLGGGDRC